MPTPTPKPKPKPKPNQAAAALVRARGELAKYGDALLEGKSNQGALMLQLITQFANNYCDAIDGTSAQVQEASRDLP